MRAASNASARAERNWSDWSLQYSGAVPRAQIREKAAAATWSRVGRRGSLSTWVPAHFLSCDDMSIIACSMGVVLTHGHLDHFLDVLTLRYALAYNPVAADRRLPLGLPPGGIALLDRLAQAVLGHADTDEFLSVFDANQYDPDASLTIAELDFHFHPTVHYVPCWAVRISNGVDGDLFYTADTGPAANLAAVATGLHLIVEGTDRGISHEPYESRGHMTPAEAGALARDAGANILVLSHLWVEDDPFRAVKEASQIFGGPVELATPGLRLRWQAN